MSLFLLHQPFLSLAHSRSIGYWESGKKCQLLLGCAIVFCHPTPHPPFSLRSTDDLPHKWGGEKRGAVRWVAIDRSDPPPHLWGRSAERSSGGRGVAFFYLHLVGTRILARSDAPRGHEGSEDVGTRGGRFAHLTARSTSKFQIRLGPTNKTFDDRANARWKRVEMRAISRETSRLGAVSECFGGVSGRFRFDKARISSYKLCIPMFTNRGTP